MTTRKTAFTMRMQPYNYDKLRVLSAMNKRSMAMQLEYLLEQSIRDYEAKNGTIPVINNEVNISNMGNNNINSVTF